MCIDMGCTAVVKQNLHFLANFIQNGAFHIEGGIAGLDIIEELVGAQGRASCYHEKVQMHCTDPLFTNEQS